MVGRVASRSLAAVVSDDALYTTAFAEALKEELETQLAPPPPPGHTTWRAPNFNVYINPAAVSSSALYRVLLTADVGVVILVEYV